MLSEYHHQLRLKCHMHGYYFTSLHGFIATNGCYNTNTNIRCNINETLNILEKKKKCPFK